MLLLLSVLTVGFGCKFSNDMDAAEKVAETFFERRIDVGGFKGDEWFYTEEFWSKTNEEHWNLIENSSNSILGDLKKYDLTSWEVYNNYNVDETSGTMIVLLYNTEYENGNGWEKITLYRGHQEENFMILGRRIDSPQFSRKNPTAEP